MDGQNVELPPPSLRPDETVQKLLISTTSRFVAEFDEPHILITHAWPAFSKRSPIPRSLEGPASRNAFMAVIRTEPYEKAAGVIVPDYSWVGDMLCELLALLYGKRFDSHGPAEGTGIFMVPDTSHFETLCDHRLPFNSHKLRADAPIPLDLRELKRIVPLISDGWTDD
ncbi:hypothetical protein [Pseudomonas sp. CC6-YY-74]|uniref:hypothetical protein n=1 Tax=Pseudomonas sp. CC6-YY-74 TaxID=1930532 RepID=UPI0009A21C26|nr:hypothetical protein [Pseudomonas sp. CC6-YY-74]